MSHPHKTDHLQTILRWGVYLTLTAPLLTSSLFLFPHTTTKAYVMMALVELLGLGLLWLMWLRPDVRPVKSALGIALSIFVGIALVASVLGVDPSFSFWASVDRVTGGLMWVHMLAFFWIVTTLFQTKAQWQRAIAVSVFVGLVTAGVHLLTTVGIELGTGQRGGSTFGNSSFFGTYLLFQIGLAAYLGMTAKGKMWHYGVIATGVMSLALLLTTANAAKISFVGGAVLFLALFFIVRGKTLSRRKIGWGIFIALSSAFVLTIVLAFQEGSIVYDKFVDISTESRFVLWNMAWQAFLEHPFLGWGLENFQLVSLKYYDPCLGSPLCGSEMWFDRAHNKVLDLLVEVGFVGLLSYLSVFFLSVYSLWKKKGLEIVVVGSVLAAYFVQNLTILDTSTIMMTWVFFLAFASAASTKEFDEKNESHNKKTFSVALPFIASLIFVFSFTHFVVQPIQGNMAIKQTIESRTTDDRHESYERAVNLSQQGIDFRRIYLANQTAAMLWNVPAGAEGVNLDFLRSEIDLIEKAVNDTLDNSPNYLRGNLELSYVLQGGSHILDQDMLDRAEVLMRDAVEQNPLHPQAYWALASVLIDQGKIEEAVELTRYVTTIAPDLSRAQVFHLIAVLFMNDREALELAAQEALTLFPSIQPDVQTLLIADPAVQRMQLLSFLHF
jgi:O-antigen ligase